jgi:hypothetical protein
MPRSFLVATFSDADDLVGAVRAARSKNFRIYDVYAPYPIHHLDDAMGIRRTRLSWITLAAGTFGFFSGLLLQFYTSVLDWPLNVGGKPDNSTLAFIPISFELTVLFGGLATVAAFFLRARLFPGKRECLVVPGVTNDVFALVLRKRDVSFDARLAYEILEENGAAAIEERVLIEL